MDGTQQISRISQGSTRQAGPGGGQPLTRRAPRNVAQLFHRARQLRYNPPPWPAPLRSHDVIRSLPTDITIADVIAQAKEKRYETEERVEVQGDGERQVGLEVEEARCQEGREPEEGGNLEERHRLQEGDGCPGTAKSAGVSKSDFIRLHPSLTTAEVITAARDQGMSFTSSLVYAMRGANAGKAATKKRAAKKLAVKPATTPAVVEPVVVTKPPVTSKPTAVPTGAAAGDARIEDILKAAASALGFGRALEVIQAERERLRAVLGA